MFKKLMSLVLTLTLMCGLAMPAFAATDVANSGKVEDDIGIAPEKYLPFIFVEDYPFSDIIDCSQCLPGYLYVADLEEHTVTLVLDEPISSFTETTDFLFYISQDNHIIRTDYAGVAHDKIYTAQYGDLSSVEYYNNHLYFLDADYVVDYDLSNGRSTLLTEIKNVASVVPSGDGTFYIRNDAAEIFDYDAKSQKMARVIDEDLCASAISPSASCESGPSYDDSASFEPTALDDAYYSLPLSEYPSGSYFTNDGKPCVNHNNCRRYACTNQCDGFARYVHEKYNHKLGSTWSAPYEPAGDTSTAKKYYHFTSDSELRLYFSTLSKSAYVRMSAYNAANDTGSDGSHSFVYINHNSSGATLYEANRDNKCGVQYHFRTFTDIRGAYPYGFKHVSHHYSSNGVNISTDYHRIYCTTAGCTAYIVEPHSNVATSTGHVCTVCGSTTGSGPITVMEDNETDMLENEEVLP